MDRLSRRGRARGHRAAVDGRVVGALRHHVQRVAARVARSPRDRQRAGRRRCTRRLLRRRRPGRPHVRRACAGARGHRARLGDRHADVVAHGAPFRRVRGMSAFVLWSSALPAILVVALVAWAVSTARTNVGLVDIFWSLFFLAAAITWAALGPWTPRGVLVLPLVALWALRLAGYLAWRNWNAPEDRRYWAIRARNEPGFEWKSLYLVFLLQGVLAWLVAAPLSVAIAAPGTLGVVDFVGAGLV